MCPGHRMGEKCGVHVVYIGEKTTFDEENEGR